MPSMWRRPTFRPLAITTSRAEIVSSLDSTTFCRSFAGRDRHGLGDDLLDVWRNLGADRVDQRVVEDADLLARRLVEQMAESRDPVLVGNGGLAQHGFEQAGLAQGARSARRR